MIVECGFDISVFDGGVIGDIGVCLCGCVGFVVYDGRERGG